MQRSYDFGAPFGRGRGRSGDCATLLWVPGEWFWSFVDITEMLKPFYIQVMMGLDNCQNDHVNEVLTIWKRFKRIKVSVEEENMIKIVLHWKMMGTLFFSICGNNLNNINVLLEYFMVNLHCKKKFRGRVVLFRPLN